MATFDAQHRSALHSKVLSLLKELYRNFRVEENVAIEVDDRGRKTKLFVDLVVKNLRVAIECHGEQHYKYNSHFHKNPDDFAKQKRLDAAKREQIELSGWAFVEVPHTLEKKLTSRALLKMITKELEKPNGK